MSRIGRILTSEAVRQLRRILIGAVMTIFLFSSSNAQTKSEPGVLRSADVLPPDLLRGGSYSVADVVRNDGLINTYQVTSQYGILTIESTALLQKRVQELDAMRRMEQLKKSDVYVGALKRSAVAPLDTAKGLITDPIETTENVVTGVGRWFRDVGNAITSKNPQKDTVAEATLGQARAKRQFAFEYGVDPYSPLQPLQKTLDDLAWVAVGGNLTISAAVGMIPGAVGTVVFTTKTMGAMKNVVRDKSPRELSRINGEKLDNMGVPKDVAEQFLSNPSYGPEEQTILIGELDTMSGVSNRDLFIRKAATAYDEPTAIFNRTQAQMFAAYHARIARVARCIDAAGVVMLEKEDGTIVGLFPLDYVVWTAGVSQKADAIDQVLQGRAAAGQWEFWLTGTVDSSAQEGLTAASWTVTPRAGERLFGG